MLPRAHQITTPHMAAKKQPAKPKPRQTTIRFSDADFEMFSRASEMEGLEGNVIQWLLSVGRKRAKLLQTEGPLQVTEILIPPPEQTRIAPK